MSTSNEATDEASRTANGAADLLDDADAPPAVSPPPSSPRSQSSAAAIIREAISLTAPSYTKSRTANGASSDVLDDDHSSVSSPNAKPSIATVTAIVNEVLRQKESGEAGMDIASIASMEVDKFYEENDIEHADDDNNRPPARPAKSHPWKEKEGDTKALYPLFARKDVRKTSALISSKIREVIGSNQEHKMENESLYPSSSPPTGAFNRKETAGTTSTTSTSHNIEDFDPTKPDYNDVCEELGINFQTHPHLRSPYRRFHFSPEDIVRSPKCHSCAIVTCLIGIAVVVTSAVTKGIEHSQKRNGEINPYWMKEEEASEEKEWWAEEGDEKKEEVEWPKNTAEMEKIENEKQLTPDEIEQLSYLLSDAYLPMWFDRSTGWKGETFKDAMEFCKSHDDFVPCPYEVYCPGQAGRLIFGESMEDKGESWAPIMDDWNEWVQVGNGRRQCTTYSGIYKRRPAWGLTGDDNQENTRHIMCCLEQPLGDDLPVLGNEFKTPKIPTPPDVEMEHGEGVDDPIPPPPNQEVVHTTGSSFVSMHKTEMTPLDEDIRENYSPFWFDNNDGWKGTTYDDGKLFCESIPDGPDGETFHLCPAKAYCPNGRDADKPLIYEMDPFDGGVQWAPISNSYNAWTMVGKVSEQQPSTCNTFLELYHSNPVWGLDGSETGLKKHILCCQSDSGEDGSIPKGEFLAAEKEAASQSQIQDIPTVQITPTNVVANPQSSSEQGVLDEAASQSPIQGMPNNVKQSVAVAGAKEEDGSHTGAGNSSPHAGEHTPDDLLDAMKRSINPIWYNSGGGWTGGSHDDALKFCETNDQQLCPYAAYCPYGPTFPVLEGHDQSTVGERPDQWAPTINGNNKWILIGTIGNNPETQCMDYVTLNGDEPSWGLDGSAMELKEHILCCKKSHVQQPQQQESADDEEESKIPTSQTSEEAVTDTGTAMKGTWFHVINGWNAGTHDDATHFCARKEVNGKPMELCTYAAYCPSGPSRPPADGHGLIGEDEDSEQWAPASGDNQWVMVGMHGQNKATQCLTHGQLYGSAPVLDEFSQEMRHHIMCCTS